MSKMSAIERAMMGGLGLSSLSAGAYTAGRYVDENIPKKVRKEEGYKGEVLHNLREGKLGFNNLSAIDRSAIKKHYKKAPFTKIASNNIPNFTKLAILKYLGPIMTAGYALNIHNTGKEYVRKNRLVNPMVAKSSFNRRMV